MKIKFTSVFLSLFLAACGGGGGGGGGGEVAAVKTSADPATQSAISAIADRARAEAQEANAGDAAKAGVARNAEVLKRTVLNNP